MKKIELKTFIVAMGLTAFVCIAGVGTYAKYAFNAKSENNLVKAANFGIALQDSKQLENARFSLDKFNPFSDAKEYPITINKNNTEVPVKYTLSTGINQADKSLFDGSTPIKMELLRKVGSEYIVIVPNFLKDSYTLTDLSYDDKLKPAATEDFKVRCSWNTTSDENDTAYAGKTGKFDVVFKAEQIKDVVPAPRSEDVYFEIKEPKADYEVIHREKTVVNDMKYSTDKDGKKVLEFGNIVYPDRLTMNNFTLTETGRGSKLYSVSCESTGCSWNGKTMKCKVSDGSHSANIYFTDLNNDSYNQNELYISMVPYSTGKEFIDFFR